MNTAYERIQYECFIETLAPVHIGCDEVYEPTGFVLDAQAKQIVSFDPYNFVAGLAPEDKQRFSQICVKGTVGSIIEIYKFLQGQAVAGRRIDVCAEFPDHFRQTLSIGTTQEKRIQQELNKFQIARTAYKSDDQRPYIPGSSVKGALRTAYLNLAATEDGARENRRLRDPAMLEKQLLDYRIIPEDPFRLVKVSDFRPVGDIKTKIVYAVNEKKKPTGRSARGPVQIFEVIEPGAIFQGSIVVEQPLQGAKINRPVQLQRLMESCRHFYIKENAREQRELSEIGIESKSADETFTGDTASLIRIGRHCGAESVTVEGHRSIKIMGRRGDKPRRLPHATTFWLASETRKPKEKKQLRALGWAKIIKLTDEHRQAHLEIENGYPQLQKETGKTRDRDGHAAEAGSAGVEQALNAPAKPETVQEVWEKVHLSWTPNDGKIKATCAGKKAQTDNRDLVPQNLRKNLFGKKKHAMAARVVVEVTGNNFKILELE
jgi:CRISPR-associated protein Csm5